MLRNDLVADLFTQYFNEAGKEFDKVFEVYDSATDYKIVKPGSIVGILSEMGGLVKPVMNYVNTTCNYELKLLYSVERGFGEIKKLNQIADSVIKALNGVPLQLSGGQAIITFSQHHTGDYNDRPRIGWSVTPKLTFKVEYSQKQDGLRYEMALIDTPFDMTTHDTRYFNSQSEQQTYYLNKVAESGVPFCEMMAPNVNSLTLQQQVYINDLRYYPSGTTKVKDLNEILMKNYAIIRAMDGDTAVAYYYYWVQNANVGDNNQALLDLKMDTIQTWHFYPDIVYSDCMIHKAHLNRWIDNGNGTVSFDGTVNSKLFEREDIQNVAKRLTKRTRVGINRHLGQNDLNEWLNENIVAWLYLYLDPTFNYNVEEFISGQSVTTTMNKIKYRTRDTITQQTLTDDNTMPSNLICICAPIYKTSNKSIYIQSNSVRKRISVTGIFNFLNLKKDDEPINGQYERVYASKISYTPPFSDGSLSYNIDDNDCLCFTSNETPPAVSDESCVAYGLGTDYFFNVFIQEPQITTQDYTVTKSLSFSKNEIINVAKNSKFNPKLLSQDYFELRVNDSSENGFIYDYQKLNIRTFNLYVTEPFTPDFSKVYIRINNLYENGLYIFDTNFNLTGYVDTNEASIVMPTSQYATMLANNKNFFEQNKYNRNFALGKSIVNIGSSLTKDVLRDDMLNASTNAISSGIQTGLDYAQSKINEKLTVDNLQNAPATIESAKGNVFFETMYSQYGVFVEEYDILPNEKEIINDYMDMYGFTYNQVDNIKNCDNIRYYHNYIEADLTNITGISISNTIREDIKNRFIQGIRFWNTDNIQYTLENYEQWLTQQTI